MVAVALLTAAVANAAAAAAAAAADKRARVQRRQHGRKQRVAIHAMLEIKRKTADQNASRLARRRLARLAARRFREPGDARRQHDVGRGDEGA